MSALNLQTNYNDISQIYLQKEQNKAYQDLNDKVVSVSTSLGQLKDVQTNALSKQNDIKNLVDKENKRLLDKKKTIDQAVQSQNRIIYFNDNTRKRYSAYLQLVIVIAIVLAILFGSNLLQKYLADYIPHFLFSIIWIIPISVGLIYVYLIVIDIRKHNLYNFDELNFDAPVQADPLAAGSSGKMGQFDFNMLGCVGKDCCDENTTTWDENAGKCIYINPALTTPATGGAAGAAGAPIPTTLSPPAATLSVTEISNLNSSFNKDDSINYGPDMRDYGGAVNIEAKEGFSRFIKCPMYNTQFQQNNSLKPANEYTHYASV